VGDIRRLFDPSAAVGVPAHITLIHPFYPAPVPEETIHELEQFFASAVRSCFRFESVGRFSNTLYLEPTPAGSLIASPRRCRALASMAAVQRRASRHRSASYGCRPTIDRARLETLAASVASRLPLSTTVTEAWLIESDPAGSGTGAPSSHSVETARRFEIPSDSDYFGGAVIGRFGSEPMLASADLTLNRASGWCVRSRTDQTECAMVR